MANKIIFPALLYLLLLSVIIVYVRRKMDGKGKSYQRKRREFKYDVFYSELFQHLSFNQNR